MKLRGRERERKKEESEGQTTIDFLFLSVYIVLTESRIHYVGGRDR